MHPADVCPGCAAATRESPGPTMCEPCRAIVAALDAARERLRAQSQPPAVFQKPATARGPNRAERRAAMFVRTTGRR